MATIINTSSPQGHLDESAIPGTVHLIDLEGTLRGKHASGRNADGKDGSSRWENYTNLTQFQSRPHTRTVQRSWRSIELVAQTQIDLHPGVVDIHIGNIIHHKIIRE